MDEKQRRDWIRQQLEARELQHRTFKRDSDTITLTIADVRFLYDELIATETALAIEQAQVESLEKQLEDANRAYDDLNIDAMNRSFH